MIKLNTPPPDLVEVDRLFQIKFYIFTRKLIFFLGLMVRFFVQLRQQHHLQEQPKLVSYDFADSAVNHCVGLEFLEQLYDEVTLQGHVV
jgi:hypothetical protein